jgi:hypothetical protein
MHRGGWLECRRDAGRCLPILPMLIGRTWNAQRNPMVIEEDCLVTCDGEGARTHAGMGVMPIARSQNRKKLNLRPMQDVGTLSVRTFTSRIHD